MSLPEISKKNFIQDNVKDLKLTNVLPRPWGKTPRGPPYYCPRGCFTTKTTKLHDYHKPSQLNEHWDCVHSGARYACRACKKPDEAFEGSNKAVRKHIRDKHLKEQPDISKTLNNLCEQMKDVQKRLAQLEEESKQEPKQPKSKRPRYPEPDQDKHSPSELHSQSFLPMYHDEPMSSRPQSSSKNVRMKPEPPNFPNISDPSCQPHLDMNSGSHLDVDSLLQQQWTHGALKPYGTRSLDTDENNTKSSDDTPNGTTKVTATETRAYELRQEPDGTVVSVDAHRDGPEPDPDSDHDPDSEATTSAVGHTSSNSGPHSSLDSDSNSGSGLDGVASPSNAFLYYIILQLQTQINATKKTLDGMSSGHPLQGEPDEHKHSYEEELASAPDEGELASAPDKEVQFDKNLLATYSKDQLLDFVQSRNLGGEFLTKLKSATFSIRDLICNPEKCLKNIYGKGSSFSRKKLCTTLRAEFPDEVAAVS